MSSYDLSRKQFFSCTIYCLIPSNHIITIIIVVKRTLYSEKNVNSLNVEYFLAVNIQNFDKNG